MKKRIGSMMVAIAVVVTAMFFSIGFTEDVVEAAQTYKVTFSNGGVEMAEGVSLPEDFEVTGDVPLYDRIKDQMDEWEKQWKAADSRYEFCDIDYFYTKTGERVTLGKEDYFRTSVHKEIRDTFVPNEDITIVLRWMERDDSASLNLSADTLTPLVGEKFTLTVSIDDATKSKYLEDARAGKKTALMNLDMEKSSNSGDAEMGERNGHLKDEGLVVITFEAKEAGSLRHVRVLEAIFDPTAYLKLGEGKNLGIGIYSNPISLMIGDNDRNKVKKSGDKLILTGKEKQDDGSVKTVKEVTYSDGSGSRQDKTVYKNKKSSISTFTFDADAELSTYLRKEFNEKKTKKTIQKLAFKDGEATLVKYYSDQKSSTIGTAWRYNDDRYPITSVKKGAFKGTKNVTIKIYTKEKKQYKKLVAMMKAAGASDTIKFKRTTKK